MSEAAPIARIRPATWFRHALSLSELTGVLESRVQALTCAKDARAAFCQLQTAQLTHVTGLLDSGGFGPAGAWIERLELEHAHQYLRAADSWDHGDRGDAAPALTAMPWRAIFAHERGHNAIVADSLRLGTIVHLSYDLPLALASIGVTTTNHVDTQTAYMRLTEIYAMTTDAAVRVVTALNRRSHMPRHERPAITGAWQHELRAQAWDDAIALSSRDEHEREVAFKRIELAAMCEIRRLIAGT
jgi:uncharacterized protein DUF5995